MEKGMEGKEMEEGKMGFEGMDWDDAEKVVQACHPEAACTYSGDVYSDRGIAGVYLGHGFKEAMQHESVQAFEAKHRPKGDDAAQRMEQEPVGEMKPESLGVTRISNWDDDIPGLARAVLYDDKKGKRCYQHNAVRMAKNILAAHPSLPANTPGEPKRELAKFKAEWEPHVSACIGNIDFFGNEQVERLLKAVWAEAKRRKLDALFDYLPHVGDRESTTAFLREMYRATNVGEYWREKMAELIGEVYVPLEQPNTPGEMGLPPLDVTEEDRQAAMRELENIKTDGVTLRGFVNILKCRERQLLAALRQQPQPGKGFEEAGSLQTEAHEWSDERDREKKLSIVRKYAREYQEGFEGAWKPQDFLRLERVMEQLVIDACSFAASQQPQVPDDIRKRALWVVDNGKRDVGVSIREYKMADFILSLTGGRDGR